MSHWASKILSLNFFGFSWTGQTLFYVTFVDEGDILMIDKRLETSLQNIKGRIMDVSLESAFIGVCTGIGWGACLEICD